MQSTELEAKTTNGMIILKEVEFETIKAETSNGRITGSIRSDDAEIQTSNGQVDLRLLGEGDYDIRTSNGPVSLEVTTNLPTRLDASTSNARVEWMGIPVLVIEAGRSNLRAQTEGFAAADVVIDIVARTSNSAVSVRSTS